MDEILFDEGGYRVIRHGAPRHDTTFVSFQARNARHRDAATPGHFGKPFVPDRITKSDLPANFVSIVCNRNGWYLDAAALAAARAVRAAVPGRLVTYGSSMGAFAAINLSGILQADYILALSPVSTIFSPFAAKIGDKRYVADAQVLANENDFLGQGDALTRRGLAFFDPWHPQDAAHAARIASLTRMELIGVPFSGHPCGEQLNRIHPLRGILTEIATGTPDVAAIKARLALPQPGGQILGSDAHALTDFIAACRKDLAAVDPVSMRNAAFLGRIGRDAGIPRRKLAEQLRALCDFACDPAFPWGSAGNMRTASIRNLCLELRRLGEADYAESVLRDALGETPAPMPMRAKGSRQA